MNVEITHPDKVLFPKDRITKADVVSYYRAVARYMLPYTRGRPVTMHRFPDGIGKKGFFQQEVSEYFPKWVSRKRLRKVEGGSIAHPVINMQDDLAYLANQAVITPHLWLSRSDKLHYPDKMLFDLDPAKDDFRAVKFAARVLKKLLDERGVASFVMTTGVVGLHIVVPLKRQHAFDAVRLVARRIAETLAKQYPDKLTTEVRKNKRRGRLFMDYTRNAYAQTSVAPYALRARPGAPVAMPLAWDELPRLKNARQYTIKNALARLGRTGDAWKGMNARVYPLSALRE